VTLSTGTIRTLANPVSIGGNVEFSGTAAMAILTLAVSLSYLKSNASSHLPTNDTHHP
jgi:hypothetical protein